MTRAGRDIHLWGAAAPAPDSRSHQQRPDVGSLPVGTSS